MGAAPEAVETAKNVGVLLTAGSGAAYACGYLVVRGRAHALGTDPGFTLLDQSYVFAGFRFVLITLFALLLASPLLLAAFWLCRAAGGLGSGRAGALEWIAIAILGALTIAGFSLTLSVSNVLLSDPAAELASGALLTSAALGEGNAGALLVIGATFLAACSVLLLRVRWARSGADDRRLPMLLAIAALQLILLPLQHGVFLADRKARALERAPEGLPAEDMPVWLIDKGANDRVVLLMKGAGCKLKLVTVKSEKLDGIPITGISSLGQAARSGGPSSSCG